MSPKIPRLENRVPGGGIASIPALSIRMIEEETEKGDGLAVAEELPIAPGESFVVGDGFEDRRILRIV